MSLHISEAIIWQETADGVSLYHTETGDFLTLNETGAEIWKLLASVGEREPVISNLSFRFAGTNPAISSRIRRDVEDFIASMVEDGLVAESGPAPR